MDAKKQRQLGWTTFRNKKDAGKGARQHSGTFDELVEFLRKPNGKDKEGRAICGAVFGSGEQEYKKGKTVYKTVYRKHHRKLERVLGCDLFAGDADKVLGTTADFVELVRSLGRGVVYTTFNHGVPGTQWTEGKVKWVEGASNNRWIVELSRTVTADEYRLLWIALNDAVQGVLDKAAKDASRLSYLRRERSPHATLEPEFHVIDGEPLNVDTWLEIGRHKEELTAKQQAARAEDRAHRGSTSEDDTTTYEKTDELAEALDALKFVSPDVEYGTWLAIAVALRDAGANFNDFDLWSSAGKKYKTSEDARTVWDVCSSGKKATLATVFYHAKAGGWTPPKRETFARRIEKVEKAELESASTPEREVLVVDEVRVRIRAFYTSIVEGTANGLGATAGSGKSTISNQWLRARVALGAGVADDVDFAWTIATAIAVYLGDNRAQQKNAIQATRELERWADELRDAREAEREIKEGLKGLPRGDERERRKRELANAKAHTSAMEAKRNEARKHHEDQWDRKRNMLRDWNAGESHTLFGGVDGVDMAGLMRALMALVSVPTRKLAVERALALESIGLPVVILEGRNEDNCESFATYTHRGRIREKGGSAYCKDECPFRDTCSTPHKARPKLGAINVTTHSMLSVLTELCASPDWVKIVDETPKQWFPVVSLDADTARLAHNVMGEPMVDKLVRKLEEREGAYQAGALRECKPMLGEDVFTDWEISAFALGGDAQSYLELLESDTFTEAMRKHATEDNGFSREHIHALRLLGESPDRGAVTGSGKLDVAMPSTKPEFGGTVVFTCATATDEVMRCVLGEGARIERVTARHDYGTRLTVVHGPYSAAEGNRHALSERTLLGIDAVVRDALSERERVLIFCQKMNVACLESRYTDNPRVSIDYYGSATATGSNIWQHVDAVIVLPCHVSVAHHYAQGRALGATDRIDAGRLGKHLNWRATVIQASARVRPTNHACDIYAYQGEGEEADWWSAEYPLADKHKEHISTGLLRFRQLGVWDEGDDSVDAAVAGLVWEKIESGVEFTVCENLNLDRGALRARIENLLYSCGCHKVRGVDYNSTNIADPLEVVTPAETLVISEILAYLSKIKGDSKDPLPWGFHSWTLKTDQGSVRIVYPGHETTRPTPEQIDAYTTAIGKRLQWYEFAGEERTTLTHDSLEDVLTHVTSDATLRSVATALDVHPTTLTRRIETQAGKGNATQWLAERKAALTSDNVTPLPDTTRAPLPPERAPAPHVTECTAYAPWWGYSVDHADPYSVVLRAPDGRIVMMDRSAVEHIHALARQIPATRAEMMAHQSMRALRRNIRSTG